MLRLLIFTLEALEHKQATVTHTLAAMGELVCRILLHGFHMFALRALLQLAVFALMLAVNAHAPDALGQLLSAVLILRQHAVTLRALL